MTLSPSPDPQALAGALARFRLVQDNSGPVRIYRDAQQRQYHSVTNVLSQTSDTRKELIAWMAKGGAYSENMRGVAAQRGTLTHNSGEYLLKTARKLATNSANRRGLWKETACGLWRCPSALTRWALTEAAKNLPPVGLSARGYAAGLTAWVLEHVTAIYLIEFATCCWVSSRERGFAGTGDGLLEIDREGPMALDWKTSQRRDAIDKVSQHYPQIGAYDLGLEHMTGIRSTGGCIVLLRRAGPAAHSIINFQQLHDAREEFMARFHLFCDTIKR